MTSETAGAGGPPPESRRPPAGETVAPPAEAPVAIADDDGPVEWPRTEHDPALSGGIDEVNQASIESFPASDPPSWIPASIG